MEGGIVKLLAIIVFSRESPVARTPARRKNLLREIKTRSLAFLIKQQDEGAGLKLSRTPRSFSYFTATLSLVRSVAPATIVIVASIMSPTSTAMVVGRQTGALVQKEHTSLRIPEVEHAQQRTGAAVE